MGVPETLTELAKLAASRHDERRKYEWKVSFAFWALMVGAIARKQQLGLPEIPIWLCVLAGLIYAFIWLRGVWVANQNDKRLSDHFRNEAESKLKDENSTLSESPGKIAVSSLEFWIGFLADWAMLFNLFVTTTLIVVFCLIQ